MNLPRRAKSVRDRRSRQRVPTKSNRPDHLPADSPKPTTPASALANAPQGLQRRSAPWHSGRAEQGPIPLPGRQGNRGTASHPSPTRPPPPEPHPSPPPSPPPL